MKNSLINLLIVALLTSCTQEGIEIYQGQYFSKGQTLEIIVDDGEYTHSNKFNSEYITDSPELLNNYKTKSDSVKIYVKIGSQDTLVKLSYLTKKILIGSDMNNDIFIYTDKDKNAWLED